MYAPNMAMLTPAGQMNVDPGTEDLERGEAYYERDGKKYGKDSPDRFTSADAMRDPKKVQAALAKSDFEDFRKNFGGFEKDVVGEAMSDTSLLESGLRSAKKNFSLARDIQSRGMSRYGADTPLAQRRKMTTNLQTAQTLGISNALNQGALAQRDTNTNRFYDLMNIGNQVYSGGMGMLGQAAKGQADREAAAYGANQAAKAQNAALGVSLGLAIFGI